MGFFHPSDRRTLELIALELAGIRHTLNAYVRHVLGEDAATLKDELDAQSRKLKESSDRLAAAVAANPTPGPTPD